MTFDWKQTEYCSNDSSHYASPVFNGIRYDDSVSAHPAWVKEKTDSSQAGTVSPSTVNMSSVYLDLFATKEAEVDVEVG
ncbi:unnamed protein product [Nippostrongylus brasiliensis]|uniref:Ovule protein n=1 Tax=Nippostrongylus brasiliensis TaxID=27835 RepID=A0A0N4XZ82_NIPBR|nr:unnamed protein product [Nippostrongylus brasiliensis]